jgi:hypothetical protein
MGELLDREADGLCAAREAPTGDRSLARGAPIARIDLGRGVVFKVVHGGLVTQLSPPNGAPGRRDAPAIYM